jgi:hypothetical protein
MIELNQLEWILRVEPVHSGQEEEDVDVSAGPRRTEGPKEDDHCSLTLRSLSHD